MKFYIFVFRSFYDFLSQFGKWNVTMSAIVAFNLFIAFNIISLVLLLSEFLIFIKYQKQIIVFLLAISYSINFILFNIKKLHKQLSVSKFEVGYKYYGIFYIVISVVVFVFALIIVQSNKVN